MQMQKLQIFQKHQNVIQQKFTNLVKWNFETFEKVKPKR